MHHPTPPASDTAPSGFASASPTPSPSHSNRVNEIDLLRFIAAMAVVLFHYAFRGYAADDRSVMGYPLLAPVAKYGHLGVELFFLISGFVILMTASRGNLKTFVVSRVARLYPAFWACCTLTFLAILALGGHRYSASFSQYLVNMTMLSGFVGVPSIDGVYWSLFVELQFYALVAVLVALGWIHRAQMFLILWLVLSIALEALPIGPLRALFITGYAPYFIAGAMCFLIWAHGATPVRLASIAGALGLALHLTLGSIPAMEQKFATPMNHDIVAILVIACFAVMLLVALRRTGRFAARRWVLAGALTYPLYLIHQNIGFMVFNALYPAVNAHLLFWGMIALALLLSYAVHRLVERPLAPRLKAWTEVLWDRTFGRLETAVRRSPLLAARGAATRRGS